jgi:hypothetical protein
MYSGTSLHRFSGRVIGAHQKIDKVARRQLAELLPSSKNKIFPGIQSILQFEGNKGPDAIKLKSPARDEPWHYYSPFDEDDSKLIELIKDHYTKLVEELKNKNKERVAFEAAWLAHAIVDGLTPAHHYPYEAKLVELRGGEGIETRTSIKEKLIMPGHNTGEMVKNNWKMWGPKGLLSTHHFFEIGAAVLLAPLGLDEALPTKIDLKTLNEIGIVEVFKNTAKEVAVLDIYDTYYKKGWTARLGWTVRNKLGPALVKTVVLAWYSAMIDADLTKAKA